MNAFWDHLKQQHNAQIDGQHCTLPANTALTSLLNDSVICPIYQYGFLSVDGPDANKFLQGQTTCDFREVTAEQSRPGAFCTPKGRMVTNFHAGVMGDHHHLLRMRREMVGATAEVMGKYIVFSKAELRDDSEALVALGLYGPEAQALLSAHFGSCPQQALQSQAVDNGLLLQLDEAGQRFEAWLAPEAALALWSAAQGQLQVAGSAFWELANIRAGAGEVCLATREEFIPQLLNLHLTGAVSFKKGCYTGQEVVARMHYRGKLKRHMYRASLAAPAPAPGTPLFVADNSQSIGDVVMAVEIGDNHSELLAVLTSEAVATGGIQLEGGSAALDIGELPYAIPDDEA